MEDKDIKIINLTPHPLVILIEDEEGEVEGTPDIGPKSEFRRYRVVITIPPAGIIARASQKEESVGSIYINGTEINIVRMNYGEPTDLPEPQDGVYYYVSIVTAQAAAANGRTTEDLLFSGKSIRDRNGRIIGILSFAQL
jgi:hypothetical protein